MELKTIRDVELDGKTILYRAPYDIGLKEVDGELVPNDDLRIKATLPTLEYLLERKCKIVILTYVKRPDGKVVEGLRTTPHAKMLAGFLNHRVDKVDDCIGSEVDERIKSMQPGEILMLENVRFHNEEMINDDNFAKELCKGKDLIVFDGFPQAHRIHASTFGIENHLPAVAGFYFEREAMTLANLMEKPQHPFTIIIGGAKISDKVDAINNLLPFVDTILVGGGPANVFMKAQGIDVGSSFIEDVFVDTVKKEKKDWVIYAKEILEKATALHKRIIYPQDVVISDGSVVKVIDINEEGIPQGWMALDIGPKTQKKFVEEILESKTVFINGPLGKFEDERFAEGSKAVIVAMAQIKGETVIAGGDTIDFARKYGNLDNYSHISLAGGATLEFLAGKVLPALEPLRK